MRNLDCSVHFPTNLEKINDIKKHVLLASLIYDIHHSHEDLFHSRNICFGKWIIQLFLRMIMIVIPAASCTYNVYAVNLLGYSGYPCDRWLRQLMCKSHWLLIVQYPVLSCKSNWSNPQNRSFNIVKGLFIYKIYQKVSGNITPLPQMSL